MTMKREIRKVMSELVTSERLVTHKLHSWQNSYLTLNPAKCFSAASTQYPGTSLLINSAAKHNGKLFCGTLAEQFSPIVFTTTLLF